MENDLQNKKMQILYSTGREAEFVCISIIYDIMMEIILK